MRRKRMVQLPLTGVEDCGTAVAGDDTAVTRATREVSRHATEELEGPKALVQEDAREGAAGPLGRADGPPAARSALVEKLAVALDAARRLRYDRGWEGAEERELREALGWAAGLTDAAYELLAKLRGIREKRSREKARKAPEGW